MQGLPDPPQPYETGTTVMLLLHMRNRPSELEQCAKVPQLMNGTVRTHTWVCLNFLGTLPLLYS